MKLNVILKLEVLVGHLFYKATLKDKISALFHKLLINPFNFRIPIKIK